MIVQVCAAGRLRPERVGHSRRSRGASAAAHGSRPTNQVAELSSISAGGGGAAHRAHDTNPELVVRNRVRLRWTGSWESMAQEHHARAKVRGRVARQESAAAGSAHGMVFLGWTGRQEAETRNRCGERSQFTDQAKAYVDKFI
jgi:hypothetical protein